MRGDFSCGGDVRRRERAGAAAAAWRKPCARLRESLFDGWRASFLTIAALALLALVLPPLSRFLIFDAVWSAPNGAACRAPGAGACWAFVAHKLPYFTYGSYPFARALARRSRRSRSAPR